MTAGTPLTRARHVDAADRRRDGEATRPGSDRPAEPEPGGPREPTGSTGDEEDGPPDAAVDAGADGWVPM